MPWPSPVPGVMEGCPGCIQTATPGPTCTGRCWMPQNKPAKPNAIMTIQVHIDGAYPKLGVSLNREIGKLVGSLIEPSGDVMPVISVETLDSTASVQLT
jgi:hypothetical protein